MTSCLVLGEALVDVVHRDAGDVRAYPGGSPLNVAVGLARLGLDTTLHSAFGDDEHGSVIARHLAESGVMTTAGSRHPGATSVAEATIADDGSATYDFRITWDPAPVDPHGYDLVHTGSIGAALAPGADVVEAALADSDGLVSFDPNIRPALMPDRAAARARIERIIGHAHVVKASDEDVAWLYPGEEIVAVLDRWRSLGPRLVVVTRGGDGADALAESGPLHVDVPPTTVADTIGAGDSFMAGLLADLLGRGFTDPARSLAFAARCAAITVSRVGADPPRRTELDAP